MLNWTTLILVQAAAAQDAEFAGTDSANQGFAEPESELSAEAGGAYATGNTEFYTVNGTASGAHRWGRNKLSLGMGANLGKGIGDADGDGLLSDAERSVGLVENARRYYADLRYDRFVGERDSFYALAGGLVDTFAGYDLRTHEQVGYSRILVDTEETKLVGELGFDYAQENYVAGVDPNYQDIFAVRGMLGLVHQFNESVSFEDTVEVYENVVDPADLRLLNSAALTSQLSGVFSVKLSHALVYDNVPVEGYRSLDQITTATLVASLL